MKTNTPRMMTCETCGQSVADSAKTCPQCGAKFGQGVLGLKIIGVVVVLQASSLLPYASHSSLIYVIYGMLALCGFLFFYLAHRRRFAGMRDATSAAADPPATVPALRPPPARRRGRDRG
jgi:hypothetical protein